MRQSEIRKYREEFEDGDYYTSERMPARRDNQRNAGYSNTYKPYHNKYCPKPRESYDLILNPLQHPL